MITNEEYIKIRECFDENEKLTPQQALYLWDNYIFDYDEIGGNSMLQEMIRVAFQALKREVERND